MRVAFIYFPDFTLLDAVGVLDPVSRLKSLDIIPDLVIENCSFHAVCQDRHGWLVPDLHLCKPLNDYDVVFVPGGMGTRPLQFDGPFLQWLQTAAAVPLITSVCTGSLLLGAAGLLDGHRATTHYNEYDLLRAFIPDVVEAELVDDGPVVTAGAVAASLDLGLHLCYRLAGAAARERVRHSMNHRP